MATSLPITRYQLDPTGVNPDNAVHGEVHTLITGRPVRAICMQYGSFFTESLVVVDNLTSSLLIPDIDYQVVELNQAASALYSKEICVVVLITNPAITQISVDYQALGGPYERNSQTLVDIMNNLMVDDRPVAWPDIIGKPDRFMPNMHLHDIGDTYGWEFICYALERIRNAILLSDSPALESVLGYIDQSIESLREEIDGGGTALATHIDNKNNPHETTKTQVGLGNLSNLYSLTPIIMSGFLPEEPSSNQLASIKDVNRYVTSDALLAYHDKILPVLTSPVLSLKKQDGSAIGANTRVYSTPGELVNLTDPNNKIQVIDDVLFVGDKAPLNRYILYVDAINGDDVNDGASTATPLKTIAGLFAKYNKPQDRVICLREGQNHDITDDLVIPGGSLLFKNYGSTSGFTQDDQPQYTLNYRDLGTTIRFHAKLSNSTTIRSIRITNQSDIDIRFSGLTLNIYHNGGGWNDKGNEPSSVFISSKNTRLHVSLINSKLIAPSLATLPAQTTFFNFLDSKQALSGLNDTGLIPSSKGIKFSFSRSQISIPVTAGNGIENKFMLLPIRKENEFYYDLSVRPDPTANDANAQSLARYLTGLRKEINAFANLTTNLSAASGFSTSSLKPIMATQDIYDSVTSCTIRAYQENGTLKGINKPDAYFSNFEEMLYLQRGCVIMIQKHGAVGFKICTFSDYTFDYSGLETNTFHYTDTDVTNPVKLDDYLTSDSANPDLVTISLIHRNFAADAYQGRAPAVFSMTSGADPGDLTTRTLKFDTTYGTGLRNNLGLPSAVARPLSLIYSSLHNLNSPAIKYRPLGSSEAWKIINNQSEESYNGAVRKTLSFVVPVGYEFQLSTGNGTNKNHECIIYI